jgi:hypothetical protein
MEGVEMPSTVEAPDWSSIPPPFDEGATRHLVGARVPSVSLPATDGGTVDLSTLNGRTVVYAYPRTGRPGIENPDGWDMIPGARGCTPQSCSFRDHFAEMKGLGIDFDARPGLPARGSGTPAPPVCDPLGCAFETDPRVEPTDL